VAGADHDRTNPDSTTVGGFFAQANAEYGLRLPTSFPEDTDLGRLWAARVEVTAGEPPVLREAKGTERSPVAEFTGKVDIRIVELDAPSRKERQ
jgi:hypothetical protein